MGRFPLSSIPTYHRFTKKPIAGEIKSSSLLFRPKLKLILPDRSGQTLVEFAIAFPILLLLVLAIIQLALIFNAQQVVTYAAFMAARSFAVYPSQPEKAKEAAILACTPISPRFSSLGQMGLPSLPVTPQFLNLPVLTNLGGWSVDIADKYYSSSLFTRISILDAEGEPISDKKLKVGDQFTLQVTHRYLLIIPLINKLIAFRNVGAASSGLYTTDDKLNYFMKGAYFYPIRSHVTMKIEDDR